VAHFSSKLIKGNRYLYAVRSIRLPDGKSMKLSKLVKNRGGLPSLEGFFDQRQAKAVADCYRSHFAALNVRDAKALEKIELMRLEYRSILKKLSAVQLRDLFDRFTVNFTYESNALEGNSLTLRQVGIVIGENVAIEGKDLREIYETRNSRQVVDRILKRKFKVSEKDALLMHEMLVRDMGIAGGYKQFPNYIHGRQVLTAKPEDVPEKMRRLFEWYAANKKAMHPLQLASRLHGKFEEIHPFEDGNGRVGRFLVLALLVNAGYPPLIIRKTQRIAYFNALEDFDNGRPQMLDKILFDRLVETHEKFFKIYAKYL
jgi:Fic family protein